MRQTVEMLLAGDGQIVDFYDRARDRWREVLCNVDPLDTEALARKLSAEQVWFERNCGDRWLGQEVFAVTAIAQFYSTDGGWAGNLPKARAILEAFAKSSCSIEVKLWANTADQLYSVSEQ